MTAGVFFRLGIDAQESENTTLSRFEFPALSPQAGFIVMQSDGVDVDPAKQFSLIGRVMNDNIGKLEDSIRHSAYLSFWLDFVSFFFALMGFGTQASAYVYETRASHKPKERRFQRAVPTEPVASGIASQIEHADNQAPEHVRQPRKHPPSPSGASGT